jgi:hypothetical protein
MKIYRGDSIPKGNGNGTHRGKTLAQYCISDGLFAKFADGGSNALLSGIGLTDMILAHVGYEKDTPEEHFSYHSPLLSFSACLKTAINFAISRTKKIAKFEACNFQEATHFVWELDFKENLEKIQPGLYRINYKSSSINFNKYLKDYINDLN